ncbi:MAG: phosphoglycerate kinase [Euryarchaeota archaeon]|nr:phosphoglycerate kinase [Euryarchaeota archaeon]
MFLTFDKVSIKNKRVLVRVDFNSPIEPGVGAILDDKRFREHLQTIQALESSLCIILTHQSRPGKMDFTSLEHHATRLEQLLRRPVTFVSDIIGSAAYEAVSKAQSGDVLMLENLRFNAEENLTLSPESASSTFFIKKLAGLGDVYINDAFGTAHRSQPSIVGLPEVLPSAAGLLMEREIQNLTRIFTGAPRPITFVLGGTKVDDSLAVAENVLKCGIADTVLFIGVVANLFFIAQGHDIGEPSKEFIKKLGYEAEIERARHILETYPDNICIPTHVAVKENGERAEYPVGHIPDNCPILDIGTESLPTCVEMFRNSGTVVLNGPAGVFEQADYAFGTNEIIKYASLASFSVVGGGHTAAVTERLGLVDTFSHISTGGGACIEFLSGTKLPAIAALERSREKFKCHTE